MMDIVDKKTRSRMMAGIRGKDTGPELVIRKQLHALGFRYRLHDTRLPGKPDIVFPKYKSVIFVNGCFWHGHDCHLFKWPATRQQFWYEKINQTKERDAKHIKDLLEKGWSVLIVWECALRGRSKLPLDVLVRKIVSWLKDPQRDQFSEISGKEESKR